MAESPLLPESDEHPTSIISSPDSNHHEKIEEDEDDDDNVIRNKSPSITSSINITKNTFESMNIVDCEKEKNFNTKKKMVEKINVVNNVVGNFGKWQLRTVLLIFLCKIPSSWFMACIIFTAPAPRHGEFYCKPPIDVLPTTAIINKTSWLKISHPIMEEKDDKEFNIDYCNVYDDALDHASLYYKTQNKTINPLDIPTIRNSNNIIPCDTFEHHAEFTSIITQFDLVCSRDILVATTQFFHLFGVLIGGILATKLLIYISPRRVMLIGMITQIACGNITGLVNSYELHVFFRCLCAVCCAQMYTAGHMIFTDITGGKYKTTVCTLFEQFWSIGVILLPGVASFFTSWSHLYMAISLPTFILIFLHRWIPDSPTWLLKHGLVAEAKAILIESARINNRNVPSDLDTQLKIQSAAILEEPLPANWWSIWKGPRAKINMFCVHLVWSIYIVIYYGMLLNIRAFSREHLEINTVIAGLCEIIGTFIGLYLIMKTTRKWLWSGLFNIFAGCVAYMAWIIPQNIKGNERIVLLMMTAMTSKIAISCTLALLTTSTIELVSDEKKKICAFSTIVWARIWLLTAPFVGATIIFGQLIPQTAFASLAIFGGLLTMLIHSPRTHPKQKLMSKLPPEYTTSPEIWTTKGQQEKV